MRRAVAASIGVHALLAVSAVVFVHWQASQPHPAPFAPLIDTRVDLKLNLEPDEAAVSVEVEGAGDSPPPLAAPAPAPTPSGPPLVRAIAVPHALPPEFLALLRKPAPTSDVVEVPVAATPLHPAPAVVQPIGVNPKPRVYPGPAWAEGGTPVHGALAPGQTIVYVLDSSGSMGEGGKFDVARRALVATLRKQPEGVRFQVVIYAGTALIPLPAPVGGCVSATADNVARMIAALRVLDAPAGRSNHAEGLRMALSLRPDLVLLFTDAEELPTTALRGVLRQAAKPATVCTAKVSATGVGEPMEVK